MRWFLGFLTCCSAEFQSSKDPERTPLYTAFLSGNLTLSEVVWLGWVSENSRREHLCNSDSPPRVVVVILFPELHRCLYSAPPSYKITVPWAQHETAALSRQGTLGDTLRRASLVLGLLPKTLLPSPEARLEAEHFIIFLAQSCAVVASADLVLISRVQNQ